MARRFINTLLNALSPDTIDRLHLEPVRLEVGHEIEFPGREIKHLFFVEHGMASMTTTFLDGSQVEVGMFGFESVIGVSALMGTKQSLNRVYTQIKGNGYRCRLRDAKEEFDRGGLFHTLTLHYVQAQLLQAMQSAGCNVRHDLGQRLARWLLLCADRAGTANFDLSQDFLADMLGCTRPTVSAAASLLKDAGVIQYSRGHIVILDRASLEAGACECYCTIKTHLDNYTAFDTGFVA